MYRVRTYMDVDMTPHTKTDHESAYLFCLVQYFAHHKPPVSGFPGVVRVPDLHHACASVLTYHVTQVLRHLCDHTTSA